MVAAEIPEVTAFLAEHAPFAAVPAPDLERLARRASVTYARRGTRVVSVGRRSHEAFVVRSGAVEITDAEGELVDRGGEGTTFGLVATDGRPSELGVEAIEDTLLLVVPAKVLRDLAGRHPAVDEFFSEQRAARLHRALQALPGGEPGRVVLQTRLRDLVRRGAVTAAPGTTVREAARLMDREHVSSLLVVEDGPDARLVGIVTDRDLRSRVLAAGRDGSEPVREVMTPAPVTASPDDLAMELVLEMTSRSIHHVPVVDGARGAVLGMVTSTDLLRLEGTDPVHLVGELGRADDVDTLAALSRRLPRIIDQLVHAGAPPSAVGRVVTAVGDAVERRLLALAERRLGPAPTAYAWVVLGSQARLEQGPGSDQDNALVLADDATAADEEWFDALATFVVEGLAACGYRRCPGDVMATNPLWRLRARDWRQQFTRWMSEPVPEAVLRSAIFFDLRALHGDPTLVEGLREHVCRTAPASSRFLAHLARGAADNEPPLGFFRGFVLERHGEHRDALDLKRGGVHAIVELARVHALALGLPQVGTLPRLAAAAAGGGLSPDTAADLRDAFEFVQHVRLRHQAQQLRDGLEPDSFVAPASLSGFDKRHLRDAFHLVRAAQHTMLQSHPLGHLT